MAGGRYLKTLEVTPPGGWWFRDPDTRLKLESKTFARLAKRVMTHRTYLGNGTEDYPEEIEHQICERIPKNWSQEEKRI